jgi:glutamate/aspartate transport system substrate-binding protein
VCLPSILIDGTINDPDKGERNDERFIVTTILLVAFLVNPLTAQELTGTLLQIQKSGKIRVGYRQLQPPMSSLGEDGIPLGYSIDLCN